MTDDAIYKAFGRALATRRKELGLTQASLAVRVNMSRASIANIERGRQNVLLHHVYHLAEALQIARISDFLPAQFKQPKRDHVDVPLSGDSITARGKAQINELIATALATRNTKAGS
jgi:transcriptional regulator with XRE-family HTH domain